MKFPGLFTCPRCGGHCWGSDANGWRVCQTETRADVAIGGCGFKWHERDDALYCLPGAAPRIVVPR